MEGERVSNKYFIIKIHWLCLRLTIKWVAYYYLKYQHTYLMAELKNISCFYYKEPP